MTCDPERRRPAWDAVADVVVLGAGATGLVAALTATEGGMTVLMLEQEDRVGGRALISGGYVDIGGGTRAQQELGQIDSAERVFSDLTNPASETARKNDQLLMRRFADESAATMRWLEELGVAFAGIADVSPLPGVEPGRYHLSAWDREGTPDSPGRLYRTAGVSHGGAGLIRPLEAAARGRSVDIRLGHRVHRIVRDESEGRVVGVVAAHEDGEVRVRARCAVIIATAGVNGNVQLRRAFDPRLTSEYVATGEPFVRLRGEGVTAAQEVGAQLASDLGIEGHWVMPRVPTHALAAEGIHGGPIGCQYATLHHRAPLPGTTIAAAQGAEGLIVRDLRNLILVKHDGRRFFDEGTRDELGFCAAAMARGGGPVWAIFDAAAAEREGWTTLEPPVVEQGFFFSAGSLRQLAEQTIWQGVPLATDNLLQTVARYNEFVSAGEDEEFGRQDPAFPISRGPYYAAWATPVLHDPYGGLRVDERCRVVDIYGDFIPGLYAGGEAVGGIARVGTSKAILTGRIAGLDVLTELVAAHR